MQNNTQQKTLLGIQAVTLKICCQSLPIVLLCCQLFVFSIKGQDSPTVQALELGHPISRQITSGNSHNYTIKLSAEQFLRLDFDVESSNIVVSIFGSDDKLIREIDNTGVGALPLSLLLISETAGDYRINVKSQDAPALTGQYEIRLSELRPATAEDKQRLAANQLMDQGRQLFRNNNRQARQNAATKFAEALELWKTIGDLRGQGQALCALGRTYNSMGEFAKSLDYLSAALPLVEGSGQNGLEIATLNRIGFNHYLLGNRQEAILYYNRALQLCRSTDKQWREAESVNLLSQAYQTLGELQKAIDLLTAFLPSVTDLEHPAKEARIRDLLADLNADLGDADAALNYYESARLLWHQAGNFYAEVQDWISIGEIYRLLNDRQSAIDSYGKAVELAKARNNQDDEILVLVDVAHYFFAIGEKEKAREYYGKALAFWREDEKNNGKVVNPLAIGIAYVAMGEKQAALDAFHRNVTLRRAEKDKNNEAIALGWLAQAYLQFGNRQQAIDFYTQALQLYRTMENRAAEADINDKLASIYAESGEHQQALELNEKVLAYRRSVGDQIGEAQKLCDIARILRNRGMLEEAHSQTAEALKIIESQRYKIVSLKQRASYFASLQKYYEFYIDLLMEMHSKSPSSGFAIAALQAYERSRARSLLEVLSQPRASIHQGIAKQLLERQRAVQQLINSKEQNRIDLLSGKHNAEQLATVDKELRSLIAESDEIRTEIEKSYPRYASLTESTPLSLKEIQEQILDPDTILLEYALGEDRSFLWVVSHSAIAAFTLPKKADIETAARQFYDNLTARNKTIKGETYEKKEKRLLQAEADLPPSAMALSQAILLPAASLLNAKRILVVPDGALQYIPFSVLPTPGAKSSAQNLTGGLPYKALVFDHEIINIPSASTLAVLRREGSNRKVEAKAVMVLADPVFDSTDPRLKPSGKNRSEQANGQSQTRELDRAIEETGAGTESLMISRLPFSRREAEAISQASSDTPVTKSLDFKASRETLLTTDLSKYRVLHFATHGLLNTIHPDLSGIVLSLVDEQGQTRNGFLRLHDVYNLNLAAELVVLSACQTALGKEVRGEGLMGLARGFIYAGAPRVMASLWKVDDSATAELMKHFYRYLLVERLSPAAALRSAQLDILKQPNRRFPYYWGAFVLQGEPK